MKIINTNLRMQFWGKMLLPFVLSGSLIIAVHYVISSGIDLAKLGTNTKQYTTYILFLLAVSLIFLLTANLYHNCKNFRRTIAADNELKKSENRFRDFIGQIDKGLLIFENDIPIFANDQFCNIFDIDKRDLKEFNLTDFLPGWEIERVNIVLKALAQHQRTKIDTWLRLKNNTEKFVTLHYIINAETNIPIKYLIVKDQTEQKHALTTIDVLSETLTQSNDSIIITDLNGTIEYVNPGFEKKTGYTSEEVIGKKPHILKSEKMPPQLYEDLWKTISSGEIWKGEILNKKKDGTLFLEYIMIFPIKNKQNETIKYSSIKTDITRIKRIEQELLAAKNKAEESDRYKTAFLNNVSHEVRTPLNAIFGFSHILKESFKANEKAISFLNIIEQNSQILLKLFTDIIELSSIEAKAITLKKENVHVKKVLLRIVSRYNVQLAAENKKIEIIVDEDNNFETMVLHTDRKRLNQIFDKLLSNAVKFTEEGYIKICYTIQHDNITFNISDTGVGIPDEEREHVFKSFSHGDNMYVSLHKGVGLGLNIAKTLIELLGGKLTFTSEKGKGTTFSVSFPTSDLKNYILKGNKINSYIHQVHGKTILIAEDNDLIFKYTENILSSNNKLLRAKTGKEAVKLITSCSLPDIILMDILMPEMDGISASRLIRQYAPAIPIIAMTAIAGDLSVQESNLFDIVLSKPVSAKELLKVMSEELEKSKL